MTAQPPLLPYRFFAADAPELPVRGADDAGGPEKIRAASVAEVRERGLVLAVRTQGGETLRAAISMVADGVARVTLEPEGGAPWRSGLVAAEGQPGPEVRVESGDGCASITSESLSAVIALDPLHIAFRDARGDPLLEQAGEERDSADVETVLPFGFSRVGGEVAAFHESFTAEPDEGFFGFGEKFTRFDKRGQRLAMWNYDAYGVYGERAYKNVPFFVSTRGYGLFVDSTACVHFDMCRSNHSSFSLVVPDRALDYYVIAGPEPKAVIARYARLVGRPVLPPKWAFGLWVSGGFQPETQDDVLDRARRLRAGKIPADVIHIDCYWQRFGRWSEMLWDREAFPEPERMIAELKSMGFRVCLWINPYLSVECERFREAQERGYLLRAPDGEPCVARLWGDFHPSVGLVDFTAPGATQWFQELLRPLFEMGVDVLKTDFGEGVPADARAADGLDGARLHNLYPLLYNDAVAAVTEEQTGQAGLVWARSSYAGGQRHAMQWAGDPNCTFQSMASTLRGGLSLGACGHALWSHDIGGFHGTPDPELFVRWVQFGLLSPLSRAHGRTNRLPWEAGDDAERVFADYARLRYRLLPYIYSAAVESVRECLPLMRAMAIEFPGDPAAIHFDLQYMLGGSLLVAPVYDRSGRRPVHFPAGRWVDFWTREVIEGPSTRFVSAARERLPLFVRANALIPTVEPAERCGSGAFDCVTFDAYLFERGESALHDTDGTTTTTAERRGSRLVIDAQGPQERIGVRLFDLPGSPPVDGVDFNGTALELVDESGGEGDGVGWRRIAADKSILATGRPRSPAQ